MEYEYRYTKTNEYLYVIHYVSLFNETSLEYKMIAWNRVFPPGHFLEGNYLEQNYRDDGEAN